MKKKRLRIRSKKLMERLEQKNREEIRRDFFELLKRSSKTTDFRS